LLKKVSFIIFWLLFFHPLLTAAQLFDIPKPSRPSHYTQGVLPQTQPISSALPDMEEESVRAASVAAMSQLSPLNTSSFTMNQPLSSAIFTPLSTEVLPYAGLWSTGASTAPTGSYAGSVPQIFFPFPTLSTTVTAGDTVYRQAAQYQQGYAFGGQQAAPVLMVAPFALSSVQPSQTQQVLAQSAYIQPIYTQSAYIQPSWPVNLSPLRSPVGFMSGPSFQSGAGSFAYFPPTPYGGTFGNVFFTSTPYPQSSFSPQSYLFSPSFGAII